MWIGRCLKLIVLFTLMNAIFISGCQPSEGLVNCQGENKILLQTIEKQKTEITDTQQTFTEMIADLFSEYDKLEAQVKDLEKENQKLKAANKKCKQDLECVPKLSE